MCRGRQVYVPVASLETAAVTRVVRLEDTDTHSARLSGALA